MTVREKGYKQKCSKKCPIYLKKEENNSSILYNHMHDMINDIRLKIAYHKSRMAKRGLSMQHIENK